MRITRVVSFRRLNSNAGMETDSPKLLNVGMMARYLRVKPAWLRAEAEAGRLPCVRTGDGYLFNPQAVEAVLLERAQAAPQEAACDA